MYLGVTVDRGQLPTTSTADAEEWLEDLGRPYILVITKSDKLSGTERSKQTKIIKAAFTGDQILATVTYSSKNHLGRKELWSEIQKLISETKRKELIFSEPPD